MPNPLHEKLQEKFDEIALKKWTPERIAKWGHTRERGVRRYLLLFVAGYSVVGVAVLLAICLADRWQVIPFGYLGLSFSYPL